MIDSDCAASAEGVVGCGVDARICQLGARGVEGSTPCLGTKGSTFLSASASPFDRSAMEARGFLCDRVDGLYCDRTARACARQRDLGASCQNDDQCPSTAYCSVDVMRTCVPR